MYYSSLLSGKASAIRFFSPNKKQLFQQNGEKTKFFRERYNILYLLLDVHKILLTEYVHIKSGLEL